MNESRREQLQAQLAKVGSEYREMFDGYRQIIAQCGRERHEGDDVQRAALEHVTGNMAEQCHTVLTRIALAEQRLARGDSDSCQACRRPIPIKRLRAVPFAVLCVLCQEKDEHGQIYVHRRPIARPGIFLGPN